MVEEVLKSWNVEQTDELLKKLEENKERKLREEQKQQKEECNRYEFRSFHGTAVAHSSRHGGGAFVKGMSKLVGLILAADS